MVAKLMETAQRVCDDIRATQISGQFDPPAFDEALLSRIPGAVNRLDYSHNDIVASADAVMASWINRMAPTAMIMCPYIDGPSRSKTD